MSYTVTENFLRHAVVQGYNTAGQLGLQVALYSNDITPSSSSVFADFTLQNITPLVNTQTGNPSVSGAEATQIHRYIAIVSADSSGITIYGVLIYINNPVTALNWAHRFASPIVIAANDMVNIEVDIDRIFRQV